MLRENPPGRLANRRGLFRRGNQEGGLECFCQFWFWWVDALLVVFRRAKKIRSLLRLRLTSAYRRCSPAGSHVSSSRAHGLSPDLWSVLSPSAHPSFFFTPSLIARSWRGTGVYPRGDNGLGLFAFGSHPKTNITSRFTRPRCKPAGVARAGFGVIL